jgi:DNA-binding beta-propeller fold protein YncE
VFRIKKSDWFAFVQGKMTQSLQIGPWFLLVCSILFSFYPHPAFSAGTLDLKREDPVTSNLRAPTAVALDANENIYVSESSANRVLVYDSKGGYVRILTGLDKPLGVAVDGNGRIYVCNAGRKNVEVYDSGASFIFKLGSGNGEFSLPVAIALGNSGTIHVVDAKKDVVKVYRPDGTFAFSFGASGNEDGNFNFPTAISIDEATGEIVVSDLQRTQSGVQGARIQVFDANGAFRRKFGSFGQGEGLLIKPLGTAVDASGRIYVADAYQNIVHVFDTNGIYQKTIYDLVHPLRTPLGIAVGRKSGKLYVASMNTSTVEVYGAGTSDVGGQGSLTFSSSGGGACTVAGNPSDNAASPAGCLLPLIALLLYLYVRNRTGTKRQADLRMKKQ